MASSVTVIVANNLGRSASNRRTVVLTFTHIRHTPTRELA